MSAFGFPNLINSLHLGSLVRMSEAEHDPAILRDYPVVAQSLHLAASAQLRNMATLGDNVLQRTRCQYFRETSWQACNKRAPGSGCAALAGVNRKHAVLGVSDQCIAAYPGDFAQALISLDAVVELLGPEGQRVIRFADLHTGPEAACRDRPSPWRADYRLYGAGRAMDASLSLSEDSRSQVL